MPDFSLEDVEATRELIGEHIVVTPCLEWSGPWLAANGPVGGLVNLKLELFQHSGSFKVRGALSNMLRLSPVELARGVTAVSAGNHAIAVAFAAQTLGVSAKVVMLPSANPARLASARAYGAEVIIAADGPSAFALADRLSDEEGRTFIHPFEGRGTALGTATLALEWLRQADELDAIVLPIGGGGLAAGVAAAAKLLRPDCRVYGVEPVGANGMSLSFAAGAPVDRAPSSTIADSLAPPFILPYSYGLCRENVDEIVLVDDAMMASGMRALFQEAKLAVEPAGAAATAAMLGPLRGRLEGVRTGVLVCGANIDAASFTTLLTRSTGST